MTGSPRRVRRRVKGWRMPANTVYVGRGSRWGNPFRVEAAPSDGRAPVTAEDAVALFERWLADPAPTSHPAARARLLDSLAELRGRHLACWCPLTDEAGRPAACHADVLLTLANTTGTADRVSAGDSHYPSSGGVRR